MLATSITDRNGNQISLNSTASGYTDTPGRTIVGWTGFGNDGDQITVSGLSSPIVVHWTSVTMSLPSGGSNVGGTSPSCSVGGTSVTAPEISEIDLPNGQKYTFEYDNYQGTDPYGLLRQINFPDGGHVRYVYAAQPLHIATSTWYNGGDQVNCDFLYNSPVVTDRYVSNDGTVQDEVLHQQFTYGTSWNSDGVDWDTKTTTVTSTDKITGQMSTTVYHYLPLGTAELSYPYFNSWVVPQTPVESEIDHEDGSGLLLRTVFQAWSSPYDLNSEETRLDNEVSRSTIDLFCYDANDQVTAKAEYGFPSGGAAGNAPGCYQQPLTTAVPDAPGPLLRTTSTVYHDFTAASTPTHIVNAPDSITVADGSGTTVAQTDFTYGEAVTPSNATTGLVSPPALRGNITAVARWVNTSNSWLTTNYAWYDTGQLYTRQDPAGNTITYSYDDGGPGSPGTHAYLTQVQFPDTNSPDLAHHVESFTWDYSTGHLLTRKGQNGNVTRFTYSDPLNRLTRVNYADGGEADVIYSDVISSVTPYELYTEVKRKIDTSGNWTDSYTLFDGFGHAVSHSTLDPDNGWDRVDTSYNGLGRVSFRSYPCAATSPTGPPVCTAGDSMTYDALNRPLTVTHSDGTQILTSYAGAATEIQDEGNAVDSSGNVTQRVTRILQHDGLGRLTGVCEVSPSLTVGSDPANADCHLDIDNAVGSGSTALDGFLTTYQYDALGNLTQVNQGAQTRTFSYDSLSRLLSADNPESGMTAYAYDANGNVIQKTDANQTVTTYQYDALNRIRNKAYTLPASNPAGIISTNQVTFNYDTGCSTCNTIGHMVEAMNSPAPNTGVILDWTSFDPLGRPEAMATTVNGTTWSSNVSYDLLGFPTWELLPSARQLYLTENTAGRPLWIGDGQYSGFNYVAARYYNSAGQPDDEKLGNGLLQGWHHDARGRLVKMTLEDPNNPAYTNWRMDMDIDRLPDSDVSAIVDNMGTGAEDQGYSYDPMNRLVEWTSDWGGVDCGFAVDRYGNLALNSTGNSSACHMPAGLSFTGSNEIVGDVYDADGNLLSDGSGQQWAWNAESQLAQYHVNSPTSNAQYVYDGLGRRTEETVDGVTTLYLRNALGHVVDEVSGSNWTDSIIVPGGERMAVVSGPADGTPGGTDQVDYLTADQVGTTRVITRQDGTNDANCSQNSTYLQGSFFTFTPFGAELGCSQSTTDFKFTGKPRDAETGLDDFGARYNSSQLGRFMTPDWSATAAPVPYAKLDNPQSLNLYSYAGNNPVTVVDRDGHCTAPAGLKRGEVGVCVASYISTRFVDGVFRGDNRHLETNGGSARIQADFIVDPGKGTVSQPKVTVGTSGIGCVGCGFKGAGAAKVGNVHTGKGGKVYFTATQTGTNGFSRVAAEVGVDRGPPSIYNSLNLAVSPSGHVTVEPGSEAKGFPSMEGVAYTVGSNGKVSATPFLDRPEQSIQDLNQPPVPIPPSGGVQ